jgi:MFS family permease
LPARFTGHELIFALQGGKPSPELKTVRLDLADNSIYGWSIAAKLSAREVPSTSAESHAALTASPFKIRNVRLFIAFRIFFNARFYYPVFTILFLDFGLSVAQFALLNVFWAATIVLAEVPSGALADILGRKRLLVGAGAMMVMEIALLCFAPRGNPDLLFAIFALNRILSGLAEASASGADEAIAYDSLKAQGQADSWGRVLEMQMRTQSIAFIVTMSLGAAVYDPAMMQACARWLGLNLAFTQAETLRYPLFLTLLMAALTLVTALGMQETARHEEPVARQVACPPVSVRQAFGWTFSAGRWILHTPFALAVISAGLICDGISRMLITLSSQYYRLIELPEASFGIIGSAAAALGLFVPRLALVLSKTYPPAINLAFTAGVILCGLVGMTFFLPFFGLLPAFVVFSGMFLTTFFTSHYLNQITDSRQRATVLSFKGLCFNLAYGTVGLLYSALIFRLRPSIAARIGPGTAGDLQNEVFRSSLAWFPWAFALAMGLLVLFLRQYLKHHPALPPSDGPPKSA